VTSTQLAIVITVGIGVWILLWMWAIPRVTDRIRTALDDRIGNGPLVGLIDLVSCTVVRTRHQVRFVGFEDLPSPFRHGDVGGGIVVANHTAGVDPFIVQTGIRRLIRWMMWADMMDPRFDFAWKAGQALPVSYGSEDASTLRKAVRHVKNGGLIGIFPEGAIERPPGEIRPFQPGVGLLARLSKAPVLVLWIHDTPYTETASASIFKRSHSIVELVNVVDLSREKEPTVATAILRDAIVDRSGWPKNEESTLAIGRAQPNTNL
jgi:1-acyl-sn-glycerol-3-phosphate acyltransferase